MVAATPGTSPHGFVPPPYPQERLGALRRLADALPGGIVDCSVGTPVDPLPDVARLALVEAIPAASGYPTSLGSVEMREAASRWMARRLGATVPAEQIFACVGTKEVVASLPYQLHLRNPSRDTVLYPAVAYPTYEMGAILAGLRAVPVPLTDDWHLDLDRIDPADAERALVLWINEPGNPSGSAATREMLEQTVAWARARGVVVAADECYVEFTYDDHGRPIRGATALAAGADGVLVVHSLSKRSNMAGLRVGFVAGDAALTAYLAEVRRHAGMMVATPVQAAATAALDDDLHVDAQQLRYARRRTLVVDALGDHGLVHDGGPATFYLWLRSVDGADDGWELAARLAHAGTLVSPGDLYGPAGADHVRLALTQTDERLALAMDRLAAAGRG